MRRLGDVWQVRCGGSEASSPLLHEAMTTATGSDAENTVAFARETDDVLAHWLREHAQVIESELEAFKQVATSNE